jgi:hypothetical protein
MGKQIEQHIKIREVQLELNRLRAITRTMKTAFYKNLYRRATKEDKELADKAIATKDYDSLHKWVKERRAGCLEGCNIRELRDIARNHQVPNYSRLSKVELIRQIQKITDQNLYTGECDQ